MNHKSQIPWMLLPVGLFLFLPLVSGCGQQPAGETPLVKPGEDLQPGGKALSQQPVETAAGSSRADKQQESETAKPGESSETNQGSLKSWPTPKLAIVITGRQHGYLEPCGCTGLDYQKGGLARRQELIRQLREEREWPLLLVDAGNQVRRFGRQPEMKFQLTVERLKKIGYQAIALGPDDLRLPAGELVASIVEEDPGSGQFLSANVSVIEPELMPTFRVVSVGDYRIGITSVLGDKQQQGIISDDLVLRPAAQALGLVARQLEEENCDLYLLLVQASMAETRALARQFPLFSYIVTSGGVGDPPAVPEAVDGIRGTIIEVGPKGMFAGVLGLYPGKPVPWRYASIGLDASFPDSDVVLEQLKLYQQELERSGLEGLGIRPVAHLSGATFVGSQACAKCHLQAFKIWADSPHAHATDSLVHPGERADIPRHHDPECLSCHVTGWNPEKYYPYKSGYLSLEKTPHLVGNGCENCHGPGSLHAAAESGTDIDQQGRLALQFSIRMTLERAKEEFCYQCHDLDNSPDFHLEGAFEQYWEQIAH